MRSGPSARWRRWMQWPASAAAQTSQLRPRNVPGAVSVRQNARFAKYKLASNDVGGEGAAGPHSTVGGGDWRCSVEVKQSPGCRLLLSARPAAALQTNRWPHHPRATGSYSFTTAWEQGMVRTGSVFLPWKRPENGRFAPANVWK